MWAPGRLGQRETKGRPQDRVLADFLLKIQMNIKALALVARGARGFGGTESGGGCCGRGDVLTSGASWPQYPSSPR